LSLGYDSKKVFQNSGQISEYVIVPVSHESNALLLQQSRSMRIRDPRFWRIVLAAVDLNRQSKGRAVKVEHKRADWVLAPENDTVELIATKCMPEFSFGVRHSVPQTAGATGHVFRAREAGPPPGGFASDLPLAGGG
jgi:hypothetical protein